MSFWEISPPGLSTVFLLPFSSLVLSSHICSSCELYFSQLLIVCFLEFQIAFVWDFPPSYCLTFLKDNVFFQIREWFRCRILIIWQLILELHWTLNCWNWYQSEKHRKKCECSPVSLLNVRQQRLSRIQVLNCQHFNQYLKCHKSPGLSFQLSKL